MFTFMVFTALIIYLGWGLFLIIEDITDKSWRAPMYVVNFREKRGRILSCFIALIKLFFWPMVYILKYF